MVKPAPEPSRRTRRCSLVASAPQPPKYRLLGRPPHGWPPDVLGRRFQRSCHPRSGSTRHPPQRGDRPRARGHRHGSGISNVQNSAWKDSESIRARHPSDIHPCGREGTGRATPPLPPPPPHPTPLLLGHRQNISVLSPVARLQRGLGSRSRCVHLLLREFLWATNRYFEPLRQRGLLNLEKR